MPRRESISNLRTMTPPQQVILYFGKNENYCITCDSSNTRCQNLSVSDPLRDPACIVQYVLMAVAAFRKPFVPPTPDTPLIVRSIDYAGEAHPATVKRSVVVPVAHLPLRDEDAIHKAKLLAGPRWTPDAPANSGVGREERDGEHGYIKISCEDFPKPAMNLKWASDVLDALIAEANVRCFSCCNHIIALKPTNMRRIAQTCSRTYRWISVMCMPEPGRRKRENISEIGSDTDRH